MAGALADSDVLLFTSRTLLRDADPAASLEIARQVSSAVIEVVRGAVAASSRRGWSPRAASPPTTWRVHGLGIRRATVLGQLLPGLVSVLRPVEAPAAVVGMPCVVFAGNVGDEATLADVVDLLRGKTATRR